MFMYMFYETKIMFSETPDKFKRGYKNGSLIPFLSCKPQKAAEV